MHDAVESGQLRGVGENYGPQGSPVNFIFRAEYSLSEGLHHLAPRLCMRPVGLVTHYIRIDKLRTQ